MMAWALFCHDFDLSKGINILSEKCPVVLDHYSVTKDTVMGVLNRLIGDQRKLYQARQDENYFFAEIEKTLQDTDINDKPYVLTEEMAFIRNVNGSTDQNSFTGMVKAQDKAFNSEFSHQLWGVLFLPLNQLIDFILSSEVRCTEQIEELDPLSVAMRLEEIREFKPIDMDENVRKALEYLQAKFIDVDYKLTSKGQLIPISLYASALYLQVERLQKQFDLSDILTKSGGLSGISKRMFTKKDFMDRYTTGSKKLIWGNPYVLKEKRKGEGEVIQVLTKASGRLEITLHLSDENARDLEQKIMDAGVSAFYLGKKGLAYVIEIKR